jgi:hypothetical protein
MAEALRPNREFTVVAPLEAIRRETVLRIHSGEITERKLARIIGLSQPQMHNVLKGCRTLKPEIADLLIAQLCARSDGLVALDPIKGYADGRAARVCRVYARKKNSADRHRKQQVAEISWRTDDVFKFPVSTCGTDLQESAASDLDSNRQESTA